MMRKHDVVLHYIHLYNTTNAKVLLPARASCSLKPLKFN